jgi:hypothetical protein
MTWLTMLLARLAGRHTVRCGCPVCNPAELEQRDVIGMPYRHPESITRELPTGQEEELAALAAELWPDDEWTGIILEVRRAEGQS